MGNRDHVLSVPLNIVRFEVLASPLVEEVFKSMQILRDRTSQRPHGVTQAHGRPLCWGPAEQD